MQSGAATKHAQALNDAGEPAIDSRDAATIPVGIRDGEDREAAMAEPTSTLQRRTADPFAIPLTRRLFFRQARTTLLIGILIGLIVSSAQIGLDVIDLRRDTETTVRQLIGTLRRPAAEATYLLDRQLGEKVLGGALEYAPISRAQIVDDFNRPLATIDRSGGILPPSALSALILGGHTEFSEPLTVGLERRPVGEIRVTIDPDVISRGFLERSQRVAVGNLLLNLLVAVLLTTVFYFSLTKPILRMVRHVERVDPEAPLARLLATPTGHEDDELGLLARTTNTLLTQFGTSLAERDRAQLSVRERELRLQGIMDNVADAIITATAERAIDSVNPAAHAIFQYSQEALAGMPLTHLFAPEDRPTVQAALNACQAGNAGLVQRSLELAGLLSNGSSMPMLVFLTATMRDDRPMYICVAQDITERKRFEDQLLHMATHDPLTGLPNRTLLLDRMRQALTQAEREVAQTAVMFLDLDRFKLVNDGLGHDAGDLLLIETGRRLSALVRKSDTVARLGGDEFVLLLPNLKDGAEAVRVARSIQESLSRPIEVAGQQLFASPSIGIAVGPTDGADPQSLLRNADTAMYGAKGRGGGGWVFFTPAMNDAAVSRLSLESNLREALDGGQLAMHFQPKIGLETGRMIGFEALMRWNHPERGRIPPDRFIPVAEETGLIEPMGLWAIREACRLVEGWVKLGRFVSIAVNVSGRQLVNGHFVDDIQAILAEFDIPPVLLELEVTESMAMENPAHTIDTLNAIKALGVPLSVDDFGTGYSSLSHLKRLPIQALKIDKSFIRDTPHNAEDSTITATIVAMGHQLGLSIIAEGVETAEQVAFLQSLGCDAAQGYYYSQPRPVEQLDELFSKYYEM